METGDVSLVLQPLGVSPFTVDVDFESIVPGQPGTQNVNIVPLPHEIAEGDTLELTLTGLPGAGEVKLSQTDALARCYQMLRRLGSRYCGAYRRSG